MLHLNETEEKMALLARLLAETDFKILPKTEKQSLHFDVLLSSTGTHRSYFVLVGLGHKYVLTVFHIYLCSILFLLSTLLFAIFANKTTSKNRAILCVQIIADIGSDMSSMEYKFGATTMAMFFALILLTS
jgi:hypothetical protein